jgi:hypothetical protein
MALRVTTCHEMLKAEAFDPNTPILRQASSSGVTGLPSGIEEPLEEYPIAFYPTINILIYN